MSGLILHRGGREVTQEELEAVPCPESTRTWAPIPHFVLLAMVKRHLDEQAYQVLGQQVGVGGKNDCKMFAVLEIGLLVAEGMRLLVGVRQALDKSMAAALAVGEKVFVCDNMAFLGDVVVFRKHTRCLVEDLPAKVGDLTRAIPDLVVQRAREVEEWKGRLVRERDFHDLLVRAVDRGAVGWKMAPRVLSEWRRPSVAPGVTVAEEIRAWADPVRPRSAWDAYNAFTRVLRGGITRDGGRAARGTMALTRLFRETWPSSN